MGIRTKKYTSAALVLLACCSLSACGQTTTKGKQVEVKKEDVPAKQNKMENKMKIEIWSDVMCPFCYIGKRKLDTALAQFEDKDNIEVVWKSYQLDPSLQTQPDKTLEDMMTAKGFKLQQTRNMNGQATQMAKQVGLVYNLDKAIPANTFNAHRFIHFAKKDGKQNEAEEVLFRSYFTDGKNIDDYPTLIELGKEIGLDAVALKAALENGSFAEEVKADMEEARQVGVSGVPFFVVNRKYGMSGAQDTNVFLQTLRKAFAEWRKENPETKLEIIEGKVCTPEGKCD